MLAGKVSGGDAAGDVLTSIEKITGTGFDDRFISGSAADSFAGGGGIDSVDYSASLAAVDVNLGTGKGLGGNAAGDAYADIENATGSGLDDFLTGNASANALDGGVGSDSLDGGDGNDTLTGGLGDDALNGADGNDILVGGAGADTLTGGVGDDVFVFDGSFGSDTITDFAAGLGRTDRIWITGSSFTSFADVQAHAVDAGGDAVISVDGLGTITLTGVSVASLQADDFIF